LAEMEEDNDVDIDSDFDDDDDYGNDQSTASVANMTETERRAHHNKLERQRRDQIKESFSSLRDVIPTLANERIGKASSASRAKILQSATEYIQQMTSRNNSVVRDISDLKKQNKLLEQQVRQVERDLAVRNQAGSATNSPVDFRFSCLGTHPTLSDNSSEDDDVDLTGGLGGATGHQPIRGQRGAAAAQRPRKKIRTSN